MTLDKRHIEGDETAINGKKWKELKLEEALERYKKMDDNKIETGSRAINKEHKAILTDLKWEFKNRGINKSVLLGTIITLGASRMEGFVEAGRDIYMKLRKIDNAYVNRTIRREPEYISEPARYPYPFITYKWTLGIIADIGDIYRFGIHDITSASFYYGLKEDTEILTTQNYRNLVERKIKEWDDILEGSLAVYEFLFKKYEENNTKSM